LSGTHSQISLKVQLVVYDRNIEIDRIYRQKLHNGIIIIWLMLDEFI